MSAQPPVFLAKAVLSDLPRREPFTFGDARARGFTRRQIAQWCEEGLVVPVLKGVFRVATLEDSLEVRIAALGRQVPPDCVVVDRTSAWLQGAVGALAPGDHLEVPPVSMFRPPGYRLRGSATSSGERTLGPEDVCVVGGITCTTALRTATDLGRLLPKDQAFAAMNGLAAVGGLEAREIVHAAARFNGYRGVVQLRALAPLVDRRVRSPGESIALLRCHEAGLPRPTPQVRVPGPDGGSYYLDLAIEDLMLAVEYDGEEWHGEEQRGHDEERRRWIRSLGWILVVLRAANVHGRDQDAEVLLRAALHEAKRRKKLRDLADLS